MDISELITKFFTSTGPGGGMILLVVSLAASIYFSMIRWILRGGEEPEEHPSN